jgi:short subunit dehydrogenase-like uncharacterized protein
MSGTYLIYGANGYMGELVARAARARGHTPILAGRSAGSIRRLAGELGLPARVFALDDPTAVARNLEDVGAVLHCAGPFSRTAQPMVDACLHRRAHYIDITGDPSVLESLAARDAEARARDIMLLPGSGFDVVPTDCLAAHLKQRLASASALCLGFAGVAHHSRGSTLGAIERIGRPGLVRRGGRLTAIRAGSRTKLIDFGADHGAQLAVSIAWGDVVTAYYSTGIPDIEVYAGATRGQHYGLRLTAALRPLLQSAPAQSYLRGRVKMRASAGPDDLQRAAGRTYFWGEASDSAGQRAVARVAAPEAYTLTVLTTLAIIEKVQSGAARPGFQTPSRVFGPDFILEIPGVERHDA